MSHVRYIDKTTTYYRGEGYATPYRWAHFDDIPFTPLTRPLAGCRVGLVTSSEMAIIGEPGVWAENDPRRDPYALPTSTPV
ncbi:MAG TPA: reductase, partial [Methylomirabilota bacterium]|nr:reductase [Methylomirabilota bacterium]